MFAAAVIPRDLADMEPGPVLGAFLSAVDRTLLNGHQLVVVMRARARQVAHEQAELLADMAEIAQCPPGGPGSPVERDLDMVEHAADEIRAALRQTRRAAEADLDLAWRLREDLPAVWEALRRGTIDLRRARTIAQGLAHLPHDTARAVMERVLEHAGDLTTGQLRHRLRRLAVEAGPEEASARYRQGVQQRRVVAEPNDDGTADLVGCSLPADRVAAIRRRVERIARSLRGRGESRTIDQLRADVFLDLLDGTVHGEEYGPRAVVDLHVDLTTLAGLDERAAEIPGWGPVIADLARQIARSEAEWRATVTDPETGRIVWNGVTRRRPSTEQARWVTARNRTCVFPGCAVPSDECDLDHIRAWAQGGPTSSDNLAPVCRHDHIAKEHGWSLVRDGPATYVWSSPLGHTYQTSGLPP